MAVALRSIILRFIRVKDREATRFIKIIIKYKTRVIKFINKR